MGDLAVDVMGNMRLRDTVGGACADPAHDAAAVTEEVAVKRRESTTGEGELGGTVVRQDGVGVLEEGDEHQPATTAALD